MGLNLVNPNIAVPLAFPLDSFYNESTIDLFGNPVGFRTTLVDFDTFANLTRHISNYNEDSNGSCLSFQRTRR